MQTRAGQVHLLSGDVVKLHYRPKNESYRYRYRHPADVEVETIKTTRGVLIGRVTELGKAPSPWFEMVDHDPDTVNRFADWWVSGKAICSIFLRYE